MCNLILLLLDYTNGYTHNIDRIDLLSQSWRY